MLGAITTRDDRSEPWRGRIFVLSGKLCTNGSTRYGNQVCTHAKAFTSGCLSKWDSDFIPLAQMSPPAAPSSHWTSALSMHDLRHAKPEQRWQIDGVLRPGRQPVELWPLKCSAPFDANWMRTIAGKTTAPVANETRSRAPWQIPTCWILPNRWRRHLCFRSMAPRRFLGRSTVRHSHAPSTTRSPNR